MAYIGKQPVVGNFQKCDAISVVNGQAAYSLAVGGAAVSPENVNHMLVSLNGVLQAPGDSFSVSGSTLTFASNLATGDVIDFVIILGDVLDTGQPSDDTVKTASIQANAVTAAKFNADVISGQTALASAPADTDEFLVSDAGVLKRIDYSLIKGGGGLEVIVSTNVTSDTASVDFIDGTNGVDFSAFDSYKLHVTDMRTATDNVEVKIRYGNGSFQNDNYQRAARGEEASGSSTTGYGSGSGVNGIYLTNQNAGNVSDESFAFDATLVKPSTTDTHKLVYGMTGHMNRDNDFTVMYFGGVYEGDTAAVDRIQVITSSGDIARGRFTLFGVKNS